MTREQDYNEDMIKSGMFCEKMFHHIKNTIIVSEIKIYKPDALLIGEGNGTPLQYSCLENPMDRGA